MRHERNVDSVSSVRRGWTQDGRADSDAESATTLFPKSVRRWLWSGLSALLLATIYLFSVRGTAILFDLRDAVSALCM